MAQFIVRNVDDDIRERLRAIAAANGRSMEEEIREILRAAVLRVSISLPPKLGSRMAARFRDVGLDEPIRELRGQSPKPADLTP